MNIRIPLSACFRTWRRRTALIAAGLATVALSVLLAGGCTVADFLLAPLPSDMPPASDLETAIAIVQPAQRVTTAKGVTTLIQWADIASVPGTVVRITAERRNAQREPTAEPIHLIGDGTPGSGRDALADGNNDFIEWDISGVRVGTYVIIATIESPDGTTITVESQDNDRGTNGSIVVTTALPAPTLTFTAPDTADVTVTTGGTLDIMWTDNGLANPDAVLRLGLDPDSDRDNGNEITLVSNQPLSELGNTGQFTFNFLDENGAVVPDGDYAVFAALDDGVNNEVTVEASGRLMVNP